MRKRIISPVEKKTTPVNQDWLNLDELVEVEVTSEDANYPIESALLAGRNSGWRAAEQGEQLIRLVFVNPQSLQRIWLHFSETQIERTQEYVLRCSSDGGKSFQEIARQQWNFSPEGANSEIEEHHADLQEVSILELSIIPDISGGSAVATLEQLRLA
ncbi:MAG: carbohydrate-binding protein [Methylococcaceae bacterium]